MADAKSDKKPNFLVIWGDDIGQSNLSCYTHGLMGERGREKAEAGLHLHPSSFISAFSIA